MSRFFQDIELTTWALVSTPILAIVFGIIMFVIFHPGNRENMRRASLLPLEDDSNEQGAKHG